MWGPTKCNVVRVWLTGPQCQYSHVPMCTAMCHVPCAMYTCRGHQSWDWAAGTPTYRLDV